MKKQGVLVIYYRVTITLKFSGLHIYYFTVSWVMNAGVA